MLINVDLVCGVPAHRHDEYYDYRVTTELAFTIAKTSRHFTFAPKEYGQEFSTSLAAKERELINELPINAKCGLILAKAVRITSIAKPDEDLSSTFCLAEDVHIDDLISSHVLKSCLIEHWQDLPRRYRRRMSAYQWTLSIYQHLEWSLED